MIRLPEAAGVGELHRDKNIVGCAPAFAMRAANHFEQPCVIGDVIPGDPELTWIGAAVLAHGGGLEPKQLGAAGGEALVAAYGQLVRPPIRRRIAAFHGMDRQRVADPESTYIDGPGDVSPDLVWVFLKPDVPSAEILSAPL